MAQMPKYKCTKEVWALKIKLVGVCEQDGTGLITPEDKGYAAFKVSKEYMDKHQPTSGGYYVVYVGGYKSFSPADAFENGYVNLELVGATFAERLKIEQTELKIKIDKLQAFILSDASNKLPTVEQDSLMEQFTHMNEYFKVLSCRVSRTCNNA